MIEVASCRVLSGKGSKLHQREPTSSDSPQPSSFVLEMSGCLFVYSAFRNFGLTRVNTILDRSCWASARVDSVQVVLPTRRQLRVGAGLVELSMSLGHRCACVLSVGRVLTCRHFTNIPSVSSLACSAGIRIPWRQGLKSGW